MEIVKVGNISKVFGKSAVVNNVSFSVDKGSIFGLIGPNGAGKTTLISMLTTLLSPSKGTAEICGFDLLKEPGEIRKRIGVVFQESVVDEELSPFDNLDIHARLYKIPKEIRTKRINSLLDLAKLGDVKFKLVRTFSGGMKRKVEIIRGLLNKPEVLFLDEPTLGLDPRARKRIWEYILRMNRETGVTVVLSTNYMEEAEFLCSHIGIMKDGKLVIFGKTRDLVDGIKKGCSDEKTPAIEDVFFAYTGEELNEPFF